MGSDQTMGRMKQYKAGIRRKVLFMSILLLVLFIICVYSLTICRLDVSFMQAMEIIYNNIVGTVPDRAEDYVGWWTNQVVVNDNVPRTIVGICTGVILAVCGSTMQSITRNPLTDPYTIGISSAALFGVTIAVIFNINILSFISEDSSIIVNAFMFSLIPSIAIVFVSSFKKVSPNMMILIGIAMMYVFSAFTTFLKFNADEEDMETIYEWSLGSLNMAGWESIPIMILTSVAIVVIMMLLANRINVLSTGDNESISLGENPVRLRLVCFVLMSAATAIAVCYTGTIGFVGLVGPHIARLFVGNNNKMLVPLSAIIGAVMVVGADCIVRMLPVVLPVGIITALIGSPLFLYFLYSQRKKSNW